MSWNKEIADMIKKEIHNRMIMGYDDLFYQFGPRMHQSDVEEIVKMIEADRQQSAEFVVNEKFNVSWYLSKAVSSTPNGLFSITVKW